ncbi:GNAT family N-acetyltransferase [Paenibacillus sp. GYB004]
MTMIDTITVQNNDQLEMCLNLRREVFVKEQSVPEELEVDQWDVLGTECRHILILSDGEAAATARLIRYDAQTAKMQRVAVRSALRGQGYGRIVMEALEKLARELGFSRSLLDAQVTARPFYERLGYEAVSEELFYDAGILHVRMTKTIV